MAARETHAAIVNALRALQNAGLLYFYQNPILVEDSGDQLVTWPNHNAGADHYKDVAFGALVQYRRTLEEGSYLAILRDGAMLRASYRFERQELSKHSLWYWPCPLSIPIEAIREETPLDAVDLYATDWAQYVRFRTPMRFDYDPEAARDGHATAHLHMQAADCRIPLERPLGFSTFVRFLYRNFYLAEWEANDIWRDFTDELEEENKVCLADSDLFLQHFGWKVAL